MPTVLNLPWPPRDFAAFVEDRFELIEVTLAEVQAAVRGYVAGIETVTRSDGRQSAASPGGDVEQE